MKIERSDGDKKFADFFNKAESKMKRGGKKHKKKHKKGHKK